MIFLELFWTFFKVGLFTFGGGYAMLGVVQGEVINRGWMDTATLADYVAISESTPGPLAINIATAVGSEMGAPFGMWGTLLGAFLATLGTALPSFIIILIIAKCFESVKDNPLVKNTVNYLKPGVIGLIASAFISIGTAVFFPGGYTLAVFSTPMFYALVAIFAISLVLAFKKLHPIAIVVISAALGIAAGYLLQ